MAKSKAPDSNGKDDELQKVIDKLEKDFGKGIIIGANDKPTNVEVVSTGSLKLDAALGVGGLPKGRIIEIYGPESSGKTTLACHVIAEAQKADPETLCAIVDAEHALDTNYTAALGVDMKRLQISQPDYGEQALEITRRLVETGRFGVVLVDSVAALIPKSEIEGEVGDSVMGKQARMMGQALRMLVSSVEKTGTVVIFINQLRDKIGVMFGSPETTTGGNALKFFASVRLDIRKKASNKDGEEFVSNTVRVKVAKNKVAPPFKTAEFNLVYGHGIDKLEELIDIATDLNIIQKSGSWYSYEENKIGQGAENVKQLMIDNPELYAEIKEKTLEKLKSNKDGNHSS